MCVCVTLCIYHLSNGSDNRWGYLNVNLRQNGFALLAICGKQFSRVFPLSACVCECVCDFVFTFCVRSYFAYKLNTVSHKLKAVRSANIYCMQMWHFANCNFNFWQKSTQFACHWKNFFCFLIFFSKMFNWKLCILKTEEENRLFTFFTKVTLFRTKYGLSQCLWTSIFISLDTCLYVLT